MAKVEDERSTRRCFNACSALRCLLIATANAAHCTCCDANTVFALNGYQLLRKHHVARAKELAEIERRKPTAFVLYGSKARTNKHKSSRIQLPKQHWTPDSGATVSVTNDLALFHTIDQYKPNTTVRVANKQSVPVEAIGTVRLILHDVHHKPYVILLRNVYYSPHFSGNLLSISEMHSQHKATTVFDGQNSHMLLPDGTRIPIGRHGCSTRYELNAYAVHVAPDPTLWHRRFMHIGAAALERMLKCFPFITSCDTTSCDACLQGGAHKKHHGTSTRRARPDSLFRKVQKFFHFGERIACDLCGPFPEGLNGEKYAIVFHDSWSKYVVVYALQSKTKEEVLSAFQQFIVDHQSLLPYGVKEYWCDNGGEFKNSDMDQFCEELCIKRSYTVPYDSAQNPYAERTWLDVLRKVRTVLAESDADKKLWPYAIQQAALIHNVVCDADCISAFERVHGGRFDYKQLHVWGCMCYYLLPERDRTDKISPRALPSIYLGYDYQRHGSIIYVPELRRITSAYHVVFNESRFLNKYTANQKISFEQSDQEHSPIGLSKRQYLEQRDERADDEHAPSDDMRHGTAYDWNENHCSNSRCFYPKNHTGPCSHEEVDSKFRQLQRKQYAQQLFGLQCPCDSKGCAFVQDHCGECLDEDANPIIFDDLNRPVATISDSFVPDDDGHLLFEVIIEGHGKEVLKVDPTNIGDIPCPKVFDDIASSPLKDKWMDSMRKEIEALIANNTWDLVSRRDKRIRNVTKSRWVYTIKFNRDGSIEKLKSRFVVCGYSQRQGIDYDRAFSATLRATSFRTLLAIAAGRKMQLMQIDVSNAFTQANMDHVDLFVEPPKGFEEYETVNGKRVSKLLHLKRALYGTKQASRLWQDELRKFLTRKDVGLKQSSGDPCLFHKKTKDGEIIVGIYVDDIIMAYRGKKIFKEFNSKFMAKFKATPAKKLDWFLGMSLDQHDDYSVTLSHQASIKKMADRYLVDDSITCSSLSADLFNKLDRAQSDVERAKVREFKYPSLVGALLYVAVTARPDIVFHTSILAKFMSDPSQDCCKAALQLIATALTAEADGSN